MSTVLREDAAGVRRLTLHRPEKKNALTREMYAALADGIASADADGIGAVLIAADGDAFCAGNDLRDFLEAPPRGENAPTFRFLHALATTDVPLVAAVRGLAVGVGTTMLLHCDLVYAGPRAELRLPFVDLGLTPEAASTYLLPARIGRARAGAALLLAEPIGASAALQAGLITALVPDDDVDAAAERAARAIAAKPRGAVRATKRLLARDRDAVLAAMQRERGVFGERLASDEARGIMQAFFARK